VYRVILESRALLGCRAKPESKGIPVFEEKQEFRGILE
jgi:hypothetical protein